MCGLGIMMPNEHNRRAQIFCKHKTQAECMHGISGKDLKAKTMAHGSEGMGRRFCTTTKDSAI